MIDARRISMGLSLVALTVLAGCMASVPPMMTRPAPVAVQQTGVEGSWIDAQGVGLSTFSGGSFQTVATDTGNRLSEGSYRYRDQSVVEVTGMSIINQTGISFNCALATTNQLNCTSATGQQFVLTRRA